jgi:hypothetical protein
MELQPKPAPRSPVARATLPDFAAPPSADSPARAPLADSPLVISPLADALAKKPLVLLRDTERALRTKTVTAIAPLLPDPVAQNLGEASITADSALDVLADIDLDDITAADLQPARIQMGLLFVGFGALMMMFLLLYLGSLHGLSPAAQLRQYWFAYIWFVCLGVAGLFMLGREAMRSPDE